MTPSIADGRDLTCAIAGREIWTPILTVSDIVTSIPDFISRAIKNPLLGTFQLSGLYNIEFWSKSKEYLVVNCRERFITTDAVSEERVIVMTDDIFLLLERQEKNSKQGTLVAWGFLYSLLKLRIVNASTIEFYWLSISDSKNCWTQYFIIEGNTTTLVERIVERMKKLEKINIVEKLSITEDEVKPKAIMQIDINEINHNIAIYESSLEAEPSLTKFQTLMLLYQKVNLLESKNRL
jgi:hypothetical protein